MPLPLITEPINKPQLEMWKNSKGGWGWGGGLEGGGGWLMEWVGPTPVGSAGLQRLHRSDSVWTTSGI